MTVPTLPPSIFDPFLEHKLTYSAALTFWKTVVSIFFRELRPRGAFNIPRSGPVIFVGAPHHNQARDPSMHYTTSLTGCTVS
jgi:1-acyl-sn-glycerol-3-phosphate acyltransferase